jgi:hypothetical protein
VGEIKPRQRDDREVGEDRRYGRWQSDRLIELVQRADERNVERREPDHRVIDREQAEPPIDGKANQPVGGEAVVLVEDKAHQKAAQNVERENGLPCKPRRALATPDQVTLHHTQRQDEPIDVDHRRSL